MHPSPGCLPCKTRKKKCDENKPECQACRRNDLPCAWPAQKTNKIHKTGVPISNLSMFALAKVPHPSDRRCTVHFKRADQQQQQQQILTAASTVPVTISLALSPVGPLSRQSQYLIAHYLQRTGVLATGHVGDLTPFTHYLLPIAHASEVVFQSIIAFSSFHLLATGSENSIVHAFEHYTSALHSLRLTILRLCEGDWEIRVQIFLAMLVLSCVELVNGGEDQMVFTHLRALRQIAPSILARPDHSLDGYEDALRFGFELYAYFLSLSTSYAPESFDGPNVEQDSMLVFSELDECGHTGALLGCADRLFSLVPATVASLKQARDHAHFWRVGLLQSALESSPKSHLTESPASRVKSLLDDVSVWEPPDSADPSFRISGKIMKLALLALLEETSYWCDMVTVTADDEGCELKYFSPDAHIHPRSISLRYWDLLSNMDALMAELVGLLHQLPVHASIVTTMCWSIAVLGSYATRPVHQVMVQRYLTEMKRIFGFTNMSQTLALLEYIWSRYNSDDAEFPYPLSRAMQEMGGRFMLG